MTSVGETAATARSEIRSLTGLRIVAALWVVLFHFGFTPGVEGSWFWRPLEPFVAEGALGVDLFYVLSGFVITLTYLDTMGPRPTIRTSIAFWWARFCRVWPVYAALTSVFGGWLLLRGHLPGSGPLTYQTVQPVVDLPHYVEQLAMVQLWHRPYFDGSSWVGPAWSISAEWLAYVAFPLVALLLWRLRRGPAAVLGVLAVGCMVPFAWITWATGNPYHPYSWLLRIGAGFVAGALTCLAVRRLPRTRRVDGVARWVALAALLAVPVVLELAHRRQDEAGGVVVVLFPVLVGALALTSRGPARLLSTPAAVHGGRISYSLYLVHVPVLEVFWYLSLRFGWTPGTPVAKVLLVAVPALALLLAHLLHRGLEEPARRALRARGPGRWVRRERPVPVTG